MELEELEQEQIQDAAIESENSEPKETRTRGLTEKQRSAIDMIIAGVYHSEIADKLGVHVNTMKKWRAQKLFSSELNKRKKEAMKTAHGVLMANVTKAAQQLAEMMDEKKPDRNRIALLWRIYEEGKTSAIEDYEERIEKLEDAVNSQV